MKFGELRHRIDEHARLGLERETYGPRFGVPDEPAALVREPVHRGVGFQLGWQRPRPEGDRFGPERGGQVHRADEEVAAAVAFLGVFVQQRRPMLSPWIEQEPAARLDDAVQAVSIE